MERASTARDMEMWKKQYQSAVDTRQELERETCDLRQEFSKEKLRLSEQIDDVGQSKNALEADLKIQAEQFHGYKLHNQQRETDLTTRVHQYEDAVRQRDNELLKFNQDLVETQEQLNRSQTE